MSTLERLIKVFNSVFEDDVDVSAIPGGQPVYYYFISVE